MPIIALSNKNRSNVVVSIMNKKKLLELFSSISLKARILREWQKTSPIVDENFSEREILTIELVRDYSPITEKSLTKFFGISFGSVADIVANLRKLGILEQAGKAKALPLKLTKNGIEQAENIRAKNIVRHNYLLENIEEKDIGALIEIYDEIDKNAERNVQSLVLGKIGSTPWDD